MAVFLSYSSGDGELAGLLEENLQSAGVQVMRDRDIMRGGGDWRSSLLPRIAECDYFLLIWSASAETSQHMATELGRAFEAQTTIIPILVDDTSPPPHLKHCQTLSFTMSSEGLDEILDVVAPLRTRSTGPLDANLRSALATYRTRMANETAIYQALYPGEEMPHDTVVPLGIIEGFNESQVESTWSLTVTDLLRFSAHRDQILLAGHPGAGKTTTLRYLAHEVIGGTTPSALPVLARCADYRPTRHKTFVDFLYDAIRDQTSREVESALRQHRQVESGNMSLLIDGLDELPTGTTKSFFSALTFFLNQSDTDIARVILTTRFDSFRMHEDQFTGWRRFSLQPLSMTQIEQCVSGWFTDENQRSDFLSHLGDRRLAELASRPFLLAMMCLVFRRGGALGTNRSDLYARAISYLEGRHAEQTTERIVRIRREVMWEIAFRSLQMGTLEVDKWTAAGLAATRVASIESSFPDRFGEMVDLLDAASQHVGILQSSMGRYSFIHRSFQEYMASQRLASTADGEGILVEHAQISRWEEPIRLYVGSRRDATSQARVLRSLWGVNQALALRALTDATMLPSGFAQDLLRTSSPLERVRMLAALKESLRDIDPKTRRRIAVETALPLLRDDSDSQVLYNAIEVIRWVDAADNEKTLWSVFGAKARQLRETVMSDPTNRCDFVPLPGGLFQMGDDDAIDEIERPSHPVEVEPFQIMRFQLTNRAYETITGRSAEERSSVATDDQHPVVEMNWFDAYIAAFRIGCRLPTEAEWEYAARSGSTTAWCFGDDESMLHEYANYEGNAQFHGRPWSVGSGKPNAFGLYDMHGNVWEWCNDWLAPYSSDIVPARNPTGPSTGDARIRRGGGHSYHARGCRSAFRWGNDPSYSYKDIGARFVIDQALVSKGW